MLDLARLARLGELHRAHADLDRQSAGHRQDARDGLEYVDWGHAVTIGPPDMLRSELGLAARTKRGDRDQLARAGAEQLIARAIGQQAVIDLGGPSDGSLPKG